MLYGALVSLAIAIIASVVVRRVRRRLDRSSTVARLRARKRGDLVRIHTVEVAEAQACATRIGPSFEYAWVTVAYGPFPEESIEAKFSPVQGRHPKEVEDWYDQLVQARKSDGQGGPYNSPGLRLRAFDTGRRLGPEERVVLGLDFILTDYYRHLTSDQRLDMEFPTPQGVITTLRKKYFADHDLRSGPYPGVSCHFGIQLSVVTKDDKLIIPVRGVGTAVSSGLVAPSVGEGALPAADMGAQGWYLPRATVARGLREELGVHSFEEPTWLSLGANYLTGQFALVASVRIGQSFTDLRELHELDLPKDKWENARLFGILFSPESFAEFIQGHPDFVWSPFALAAFTHHLVHEFGIKRVSRAIGELSVPTGR